MASAEDHQRWAERNLDLYAHLAETEWSDWAMTAAFYAGLHFVNAVLVARKRDLLEPRGLDVPHDHKSRKAVLAVIDPGLGALYEALETRSHKARYRCEMPNARDVKYAATLIAKLRTRLGEI